jgi:predicted nucleic acid-binding Zn ribbon protein
MLRKLYRLDDAARRMRARVLTVIFAAAFAIIIAMIVLDFVRH